MTKQNIEEAYIYLNPGNRSMGNTEDQKKPYKCLNAYQMIGQITILQKVTAKLEPKINNFNVTRI